jgi:two-component system chemotaxis sensor kinase CheA
VDVAIELKRGDVRVIDGREVVTHHGTRGRASSTLQLCRLEQLFGLEGVEDGPDGWGAPEVTDRERSPRGLTSTTERARDYIVVAQVGARKLGLVVSALVGKQSIVIKALGPSIKGVRGFAGASEIGDERIALVIDAPALIEDMTSGAERLRVEAREIHG